MAGIDKLTMTLIIPPLDAKYKQQSWKLKLEGKGQSALLGCVSDEMVVYEQSI